MTSRIAETFAGLKARGQMAFIPFVAAGDPTIAATGTLVKRLAESGADLIEIGFPYSDPIADGPVIQSAYTRALRHKLKLQDIFEAVGKVSKEVTTPLVGMVSFAIVFRAGREKFLADAAKAGFAGLIVPDLPGDESAEFATMTKAAGLDLIQLVAPTTPVHRVEKILKSASGFVYCIAVAGTTGVRDALTKNLLGDLDRLRPLTDLPLCVGFGINKPEQVGELRGRAQGVIVGSAVVRHLEGVDTNDTALPAAVDSIGQYAASMAAAAHQAS